MKVNARYGVKVRCNSNPFDPTLPSYWHNRALKKMWYYPDQRIVGNNGTLVFKINYQNQGS